MKKIYARKSPTRRKGIGKNRTRRQFPNRTCVATVSDPLNLWKCWASYFGFSGFGRRGVPNAKPRRRWWGPRQTIWKRTKTGGMVIYGHRRPDHFYAKLTE